MTIVAQAAEKVPVRHAVDSRPPALTWWRPLEVASNQPMLDLAVEDSPSSAPPPHRHGVRTHVVAETWTARPATGLPDATAWSVSLAQAMVETFQGRRAPAQLSRWVSEVVLAGLTMHCRRRARAAAAAERDPRGLLSAPPIVLHSVRVQHPHPEVAEVSAHLRAARRSFAVAFRLEAQHGRWLCTALELGPSPA